MKILISTILLVISGCGIALADPSNTNKNGTGISATGKRIDASRSDSEVVLTISKEQIENGDFKNIGELLQAASKKSELDRPTRESVQELVALMDNKEVTDNMVELTATAIVNQAALKPTDRIFDETSAPRYSVYMRAFRLKAMLIVKKHFSAQNMTDGLVTVYQNIFTQNEVNLLLEMSRSDAWKVWQKHNLEVVNDSIASGFELAKSAVPELVKLSDDALQQARDTETINLTAPTKQ